MREIVHSEQYTALRFLRIKVRRNARKATDAQLQRIGILLDLELALSIDVAHRQIAVFERKIADLRPIVGRNGTLHIVRRGKRDVIEQCADTRNFVVVVSVLLKVIIDGYRCPVAINAGNRRRNVAALIAPLRCNTCIRIVATRKSLIGSAIFCHVILAALSELKSNAGDARRANVPRSPIGIFAH